MEQIKRPYETTFIVNASLEDPQIETVIVHTVDTITRNGGEVTAINKWGRKRLAYSVKKKNNGYYVNLEFNSTGSVIPQLERGFILEENILRFLTIQLDKKAIQAKQLAISKLPLEESDIPIEIEKEPLFGNEDEEISKPDSI